MIVAGPDIPRGEKREMEVYLQDIMPTAIEYAGGTVPSYVEFKSLKSLIQNEQERSSYPEVYGAYMDVQRMIRKEDYKLIVYPRAGTIKLFDLAGDPLELNDLSAIPAQQDRVEEMFGNLKNLMAHMGDTLDLDSYSYN
jgi:arylsulfatase A-like enzyme